MTADPLFTYTFENGVHHITAHQSTSDVVNALLDHLQNVFENLPDPVIEKVRILLDFHLITPPPISEWFMPVVTFFRRPGRKTGLPVRIVYLYPQASRGTGLSSFLAIQRFLPKRATVRFFSELEQETALEWLRL